MANSNGVGRKAPPVLKTVPGKPRKASNGPLWLVAIVAVLAVFLGGLYYVESSSRAGFVITGYVPEYRLEHVQKHMASVASAASELILFSVQPTSAGDLSFTVGLSIEQIDAAVAVARGHGVRSVLLCVGGGGRSSGFSALVGNTAARAKFAQNIVKFCQHHNLSGIDLDWEAPSSKDHYRGYSQLIVELKHVLSQHNLLVTAAVHHWQDLGREAFHALDRVHVMAYDLPGEHATLASAKFIVRKLTDLGVSPARLVLGIPAYGRGVTNPGLVQTFSELVERSPAAFDPARDTTPDAIYYNGPDTVRTKARWARQHGLAGVMFWEIGQDYFADPAKSLLAAAARGAFNA